MKRPPVRSLEQTPRSRLTLARLMAIVALVGIHLATVRALLMTEPIFGLGTVYSEQYSERGFSALSQGMNAVEVLRILGPPLRMVPWHQVSTPQEQSMWMYSDQPNGTANFHRRWVLFENGEVVSIINDFWYD